jgi:sulfur carrier protein ThiS
MKVRVDLFGTLNQKVSGDRQAQGIEVEIAEGTTVNDLLALLKIEPSRRAVVVIDGRIRKANDTIPDGSRARIFQPVHGG